MMDQETKACANLWASVLSAAMLDYRKDWLRAKLTSQKQAVEADARAYLTGYDGREVQRRAGRLSSDRSIRHALAEITAAPGKSVLDPGQRAHQFDRIFGGTSSAPSWVKARSRNEAERSRRRRETSSAEAKAGPEGRQGAK